MNRMYQLWLNSVTVCLGEQTMPPDLPVYLTKDGGYLHRGYLLGKTPSEASQDLIREKYITVGDE